MKKMKINPQKLLYPAVIILLILVIAYFYVNSINYYNKTKGVGEKIRLYIKQVALDEVETEKADQLLELLQAQPPAPANAPIINNPFRQFTAETETVVE